MSLIRKETYSTDSEISSKLEKLSKILTDWKVYVKEQISKSPLLKSTEPAVIEELKKKYEK